MESVILFGLGNGRLEVERTLDRTKYEIVGYSDSFSTITVFNNKPFIKMKQLYERCSDIIIITIMDKSTRMTIKNKLINEIGINEKKIIIYYELMDDCMKVDRIFQTAHSPYEGVVLGMSHAEVGIIPDMLPFKCCNLAISSQDIFCNYSILKYSIKKYSEKLNLKYLLIDIYDYYWLNNDLSLTKNVYPYICMRHGYRLEEHNISRNKNITDEQRNKIEKMTEKKDVNIAMFSQLEYRGEVMPDDRKKYIDNNDISSIKIEDYIKNRHPQTIIENKLYFENILKLARKTNPNVKIILFFLPRYVALEEELSKHNHVYKEEYYAFLLQMKKKYGFEFYNLRKYKEISSNKMFFYDVGHLNYAGAVVATSYINKIIFS